jgi:hypothetical protein
LTIRPAVHHRHDERLGDVEAVQRTSMTRCRCAAHCRKTASSCTPALLTTVWIAPPSNGRSHAARAYRVR